MRTRRANRTKSYKPEKLDFESSSEEQEAGEAEPAGTGNTPSRRRGAAKHRKTADESDENFDEGAAAEEAEAESQDDDGDDDDDEPDTPDSDASVDVPGSGDVRGSGRRGGGNRTSRQRIKPIKSSNVRAAAQQGKAEYLPLEPVTQDTRSVRPVFAHLDRYARGQALIRGWYGPNEERIVTAQMMMARWSEWAVLPPKQNDSVYNLPDSGIWAPKVVEMEDRVVEEWAARLRAAMPRRFGKGTRLSNEEAQHYMQPAKQIPVLMGPGAAQQDVKFKPGDAYILSQAGTPYDEETDEFKVSAGWIFDAGGIVTSMDWSPQRTGDSAQLLALAVIPHKDQEPYEYEAESRNPDFEKYGTVQLWEFRGEEDMVNGYARPRQEKPRLRKMLCFDTGRARRVKWSPSRDVLAVLCGDGMVYVVSSGDDGDGGYEKLDNPIAVLGLQDEYSVKATSMTWVTVNRLAVGYSDGSICLWSIHPSVLLSRHPVHHNDVVEMATGYPTLPYIIASSSIAGKTTIVDLTAPSYERTETTIEAVTAQPNLLSYSDHLLGFLGLYPTVKLLNTAVGFMHSSQFPLARRVFLGESLLTCLSVGRQHPFLLVGQTDGSLWALNPVAELFSKKTESSDQIRLFQHEYRPAEMFAADSPAAQRGASQIVQGFKIEKNRQPTAANKPVAKGKKAKKKSARAPADEDEDEDGGRLLSDPKRAIVYEALTRITAVEWNANEGYGHWAAAAMGSGLVRVLDLGLEDIRPLKK